jgi:hypothetical protein
MNESTDNQIRGVSPAAPLDPAANAKNWADGMKWVAWLTGILGLISGIIIGSQTTGYSEHPLAWYGVAVAAGSIMSGVVIGGLSVALSSVAALLKRDV